MKSLWEAIQKDPIFMRKLNGHLTLHWLCHFPVVIFLYFYYPATWDKVSILYLALVSIYANVAGHLAAWQAARVEVKQEKESDNKDSKKDLTRDTSTDMLGLY
jgi:hypothetical protein